MDLQFVQSIYQNPAVKLEPHIIAGNLKRSEKALGYSQYLTDASVLKAKNYLNEHRVSLKKFLLSNIDHYRQAEDGDGIVDLFNHADAIASF
jgi:hypothetical protein